MNTFAIQGGDLALAGGSFATISGREKVEQDLAVATLTPYGSDRFHQKFGSVLSQYVGTPTSQGTAALIKAEVTRVISQYQNIQLANLNSFVIQGLTSPYNAEDMVQGISSIDVNQAYDTFEVSAQVTTLAGQSATVATSVSANSVTASK